MNRTVGRLLITVGVGHAMLGILIFPEQLAAMLRDGVFNAIPHRLHGFVPDFRREAAFWFVLYGPVLVMLGQITGRADRRLARVIGWNLLVTGLAGVVVMPVSGFWLLIGAAALLLRPARREAAA
jgi:hypothetical protein